MTQWNEEVDVVVVGSGSAAMAAAISAADEGMTVTILESTEKWGGSTAMSGGGMWLPNNRLMQRDGVGDSRDEALTYMEHAITQAGYTGPAVSPERREAFVDHVNGFVDMMEAHGTVFARAAEYPDYYPELPGGKIGRSIEVYPLDAKLVGDWWKTSRGQDGVAMPMMTDDVWEMGRAWSSSGGVKRVARVGARTALSVLKGQRMVGCGAALVVIMLKTALNQGTSIYLNSPLTDLVMDGERVVGVKANRDGQEVLIRARKGVVLGAGGFAANSEMREQYQGVPGWTSANPGNNGAVIQIAKKHGAALELMDDAWWGASLPAPTPDFNPSFIVGERSMPYSIIVNDRGERFANESESYVDLGHHMLEDMEKGSKRFWMILDKRHVRRYLRTFAIIPGLAKAQKENGTLYKASTLTELARLTGIDGPTLQKTVERYNGMARAQKDADFHRGDSAYDRYYGDPSLPNPNLGTIEKGPFLAYEIVPGDLGTKGGVLTDEKARALRADGSIIESLYAAGNASASVMGRTYPGPGSTIGPAVVFGYIAGKDLATR